MRTTSMLSTGDRMLSAQEFQSAAEAHGGSIEDMLAEEAHTQVPQDYLALQPAIGPQHRHFLASWIVTVRAPSPISGPTS